MPSKKQARYDSDFSSPIIISCTVIDIDTERYTVDLRSNIEERTYSKIQIATASDWYSGAGIHFMPTIGTRCFLCKPSDSINHGFIISYESPPGDNQSFKGNKPSILQGEIRLQSPDNSSLTLKRGGVIDINAAPLTRTILNPRLNTITNISQNYKILGIPGRLIFKTFRTEETTGTDSATRYVLGVKSSTEEDEVYVHKIGWTDEKTHTDSPALSSLSTTSLTFKVGEDGSTDFSGGDSAITLGRLELTSNEIKLDSNEIEATTDKIDLSVRSTATDGITIDTPKAQIKTTGTDVQIDSSSVNITTTGTPVTMEAVLKADTFLTDLNTLLEDLLLVIGAIEVGASILGIPPAATPSTSSVVAMQAKIASLIYKTKKLNSE